MSAAAESCFQVHRYEPGDPHVRFCGQPESDYFHQIDGVSASKHPYRSDPPAWLPSLEHGFTHDWPARPSTTRSDT